LKKKIEKDYIIDKWLNNNSSYREIAYTANVIFETDYWDSERIRDVIRKYRKKEEKKSIELIKVPSISNSSFMNIQNKKLLIMADWHYPFHREDILDIISRHANEVDVLIVGGDALNVDSLSRFLEINKMSFEEEITSFYNFMVKVRNVFPIDKKIIFIRGNHEYRLYKSIAAMHEKQLSKFINPEVLQMLVDGFTIYEGSKSFKYEPIPNISYIPHWFININNELIVAHPEEFSKVPSKTIVNAIDYFNSRFEQYSTVIIGHLHKFSEVNKNGKYGIQLGCLCKPQKYADKGSFTYSPQDYNYAIMQFDSNGKIDRNASKVYYLDELYPITEKSVDYKVKI